MLERWLEYLEEQVGFSVYVWGAQGEKAALLSNPESWIKKRSTSSSTAKKAVDFYRKMVEEVGKDKIRFFDCSGLAMYFFQNLNGIAEDDTTAHGLWRGCTQLEKGELLPGDFVFRYSGGRMTHIGYVAADGMVIEARASGYGVERRPISAGEWTHYGRHKWLKAEIGTVEKMETVAKPEARRSVKQWQNLLLMWDPNCLPEYGADDKYGKETDAAVAALIADLQALREERG